MSTNRRLRLTEILPEPYVARTPEDDRYQPPPTDPEEDARLRHVVWPDVLTFSEACLVFANTIQEGLEAWRNVFPRSAEVHDGVRSTEAGVDVQWISTDDEPTTDGEDGGDNGRQ